MQNFSVDGVPHRVLRTLLPAQCHGCNARTDGPPMCAPCAASLPWNAPACRACAVPLETHAVDRCPACLAHAPPHDHAWAAFRYEPPVARAIVDLKFHARLAPAHVLGTLMASRLAARPQPLPERLVPVPLHAARLRRRGYNQAREIARVLSACLSIPLVDAARRQRATAEQTQLSAAQRRRNLRGAFMVDEAVAGRHVALVDDVITTGATLSELARAVRGAGARRIEVWAAARTP